MLFNVYNQDAKIVGHVEADDTTEAWYMASKIHLLPGDIVQDVRPTTEKVNEEKSLWEQVKELVERRGEKAKALWMVAGGYIPIVPPSAALDNLKRMAKANVLSWEHQEEAEILIRELEGLFGR